MGEIVSRTEFQLKIQYFKDYSNFFRYKFKNNSGRSKKGILLLNSRCNIKYNNFNSLFTYLKIEYNEAMEDHLFNRYEKGKRMSRVALF